MKTAIFALAAISAHCAFSAPGVVLRFDDAQPVARWRQLASVFDAAGAKMSIALPAGHLKDAEQEAFLREASANGHEIMDHAYDHALYSCRCRDAAEFASLTNLPFVAESDAAALRLCFRYRFDAGHARNWRFRGCIKDGKLVVAKSLAKKFHRPDKLYIPSLDRVFGFRESPSGEMKLFSFWYPVPVSLPDSPAEEMVCCDQRAFSLDDDVLRFQAKHSVEAFKRLGLPPPKTWIQPGGWEPWLPAETFRRVYALEFGYTGADCLVGCEKDGVAADLSLAPFMFRPLSYLDAKSMTPAKIRAAIEDSVEHNRPICFLSHMQPPEGGTWDKWLEETASLLKWLRENSIPVKTFSEVTANMSGISPEDVKAAFADPEPWRKERVGVDGKCPAPWTPPEWDSSTCTFSCWNRSYRFGGGIIPDAISSGGEYLFARAPKFEMDGKAVSIGAPRLSRRTDEAIETVAVGTAGDYAVETRVKMEFDGFAWVDVELSPKAGAKPFSSLSLDIPFLKRSSTLFNAMRKQYMNFKSGNAGLFREYSLDIFGYESRSMFVGNDDVGFVWHGDSLEDWYVEKCEDALRLVPGEDANHLLLTFANRTVRQGKRLRYSFGFQALPVKPLPRDWRYRRINGGRPGDFMGYFEWETLHNAPGAEYAKSNVVELAEKSRAKYGSLQWYLAGFTTSPYAKPWIRHGGEWSKTPPDAGTVGSPGRRGSAFCWLCVAAPGYADYYTWTLRDTIRKLGVDGLYFDNQDAQFCDNQVHGCGFRDWKGTYRPAYNLLATRDFNKRLYKMAREETSCGPVMRHMSMKNIMAADAFADTLVDGECYCGTIAKDESYYNIFSPDMFRAMYRASPWGMPRYFIPQIERSIKLYSKEKGRYSTPEKAHDEIVKHRPAARHFLGYMLVHDTLVWPGGGIDPSKIRKAEDAFMKYPGEERFVLYTSEDNPFGYDGGRFMVSVRVRGGKALVIAMNDTDAPKMLPSPDAAKWAALGLPSGCAFKDVETGRPPQEIPPRDYAVYETLQPNATAKRKVSQGDILLLASSCDCSRVPRSVSVWPFVRALDAKGKTLWGGKAGVSYQRAYDPVAPHVQKWNAYARVKSSSKDVEKASAARYDTAGMAGVTLPPGTAAVELFLKADGGECVWSDETNTITIIEGAMPRVRMKFPDLPRDGIPSLDDAALDARLAAREKDCVTLESVGDRTVSRMNGRPFIPRIYKTSRSGSEKDKEDARLVPAVFSKYGFNMFVVTVDLAENADAGAPERVRAEFRERLRHAPDAHLMLNFHVSPWEGWGEANPSEVFRGPDGKYGLMVGVRVREFADAPRTYRGKDRNMRRPAISYTSMKFADEAGKVMAKIVRHLEETPEGKALAGVYIGGGCDGQWFDLFDQHGSRVSADYSDAALNGFREYLKSKYGDKTNASANIPSGAELWTERKHYSEHGPSNESDYKEFLAYSTAKFTGILSSAVREACGGRLLVGGYYSNGGLSGFPKICLSGTKFRLQNDDGWNFTSIVPSYAREYVDPVMAPIFNGSYVRRGRLYIGEMDIRNPEVDNWKYWGSAIWKANHTPETFRTEVLKHALAAVTAGGGYHGYDMNGNWFSTPAAMETWRVAAEVVDHARPMPLSREGIAFVGGERYHDFQSFGEQHGRMLAYALRDSIPRALSMCGMPHANHLADEVLADPSAVLPGVVVFGDMSTLKPCEYETIRRRYAKENRVFVYTWRLGLFAEGGEAIEKSLGLKPSGKTGRFINAQGRCCDPLMDSIQGRMVASFFPWGVPQVDGLVPEDGSGWKTLACFEDIGIGGVFVRRAADFTEVYIAQPAAITPAFCRNLAREAGFSPLLETDDISGCGSGIFWFLAQSDGKRQFKVPAGFRPGKVLVGPSYANEGDGFSVPLKTAQIFAVALDPCR